MEMDTLTENPSQTSRRRVIEYEEKKRCSNCCLIKYIRTSAMKFYSSILYPKYFLIFNVICIVQTIPALYYYISFFQKGLYILNSTGMAPVWGCTIGAIATAIVTSALVPIPANTITRTFCIAIILWEFLVSISLFIACICLAAMYDFHGFVWSLIGSISTLYAGCFLYWLGCEVSRQEKKLEEILENKYAPHNADYSLEIPLGEMRSSLTPSPVIPLLPSANSSACPSPRSPKWNELGLSSKSGKDIVIQIGDADEKQSEKQPGNQFYRQSESTRRVESSSYALTITSNNTAALSVTGVHDNIPRRKIELALHSEISEIQGNGLQFDDIYGSKQEEKNKQLTLASCFGTGKFIIIQILLWAILFVFAVIPTGFGVQQAFQAWELNGYRNLGKYYQIPSSVDSRISVKMRIYCVGPINTVTAGVRPTILLEADAGESGFSLYNMQVILSNNWRVCSYDRGGYGWSQLPPLGTESPDNTAYRLNKLLQVAGEGQVSGIILVAHGGGGEISQIYATYYPAQVYGLAILDGYPNIDRLQGFTTAQIYQSTIKLCGNLQISRALETVAIMRAVTDVSDAVIKEQNNEFIPSSQLEKYRSTKTNGRYWAAQYNSLCVNAGAPTAYTDYLDTAATATSPMSALFSGNNVAWPSITAGRPVLIVSAGNTINKNNPDSIMYHKQAALYNRTLSTTGTSKWIVCLFCDHTLAYDHDSTVVANDIDLYFSSHY